MTPKEKAKELVDKYLFVEIANYTSMFEVKQCALIAVDEILDITKRPTYNQENWNEITGFRYDKFWEEVKHEIEKL